MPFTAAKSRKSEGGRAQNILAAAAAAAGEYKTGHSTGPPTKLYLPTYLVFMLLLNNTAVPGYRYNTR